MFFFLPSGKRRRQESFIRKCWRQDELLRKRPKRRKYLILSIINKKLLTLTRIAFEISSILEEINYCRERDKLCPRCTVIDVRLPCIVGKPSTSVHVCQSSFPSFAGQKTLSLEKESIVLIKVREKPRIFRHPKLCLNHAPVVDTISASRGYPFKRAFAVIIVEIQNNVYGKR